MANKTKREILALQGMYVAKGNTLIQKSRYSLSLTEQKAVLFMISKIKPHDEPFTEYTFSIKDFCLACNFDNSGGFYMRYVKECINKLAESVINIELEDKTIVTHWFSSATIHKEEGTISFVFDRNISPFLYELHSFYTQYSLENILPMKSKYGIRLYEFLRSIQSIDHKQVISILELRLRIGCDKYPNFADFRKNVIEPAIQDINTFSDIRVVYNTIKTGRKVTEIEFVIRPSNGDIQQYMNRSKALGWNLRSGQ